MENLWKFIKTLHSSRECLIVGWKLPNFQGLNWKLFQESEDQSREPLSLELLKDHSELHLKIKFYSVILYFAGHGTRLIFLDFTTRWCNMGKLGYSRHMLTWEGKNLYLFQLKDRILNILYTMKKLIKKEKKGCLLLSRFQRQ